tara:strand:- start:12650 stop:13036 length:387 start_codon:yes stop_codon:yes gene_type:complete
MVLTPLEIIALIFAVIILLKILLISTKSESLRNLGLRRLNKDLWQNIWTYISIIGAIIIFYFLLQEINIIQLAGAVLGTSLVMGIIFLAFPRQSKEITEEVFKNPGKLWFFYLIYVLFSLLILYVLFV